VLKHLALPLLFSALLFVFLPTKVFAVSEASCDGGKTCYCDGLTDSGTVVGYTDLIKPINSIAACKESCLNLTSTASAPSASYKFQCDTVDSTRVTPDGGAGPLVVNEDVDTTDNSGALVTQKDAAVPNLNVEIPGLDLEGSVSRDPQTGRITSNMLGLYIRAAYRYLIGAGSLVAVVMLMVGGLEYLTSAGSAKRVEKGKGRMRNAVTGLIILLLAYNLAFFIDPNTVMFDSLSLRSIDEIPYELQALEDASMLESGNAPTGGDGTANLVTITGTYLIPPSANQGNLIDPQVLVELQNVSKKFYDATGKKLRVTSASRTVATQAEMFYRHCIQTGGKCDNIATCDPTGAGPWKKDSGTVTYTKGAAKPWSMTDTTLNTNKAAAIAKLTENGKARNCPHTSNVAVDIWPEGSGGYTANVDQMKKMTELLTSHDDPFCRLNSEAWHFDLDRISMEHGNCKTSNSSVTVGKYTPAANCLIYNFKTHACVTPRPN
jgi:hypothetical protein